jgi:hypothetical protein
MLFVVYIIVLPFVFTNDIEWSFIERSCALNKKMYGSFPYYVNIFFHLSVTIFLGDLTIRNMASVRVKRTGTVYP